MSNFPLRGIFGGTFDPVHNGHLKCANALTTELQMEQLHLMPNAIPPHRPQPGASAEQRLAMVRLACQPYPRLQAEDYELQQDQRSYTVNTLRHFYQQFEQHSLLFIMGMDSLVSLDKWYHWQQLTQFAHLVVLRRPGYQPDQASEFLQDYIQTRLTEHASTLSRQRQGCIYLASTPLVDVSATDLRQKLATGKTDIPVPKTVARFIQHHQLYRQN
ncbi:nicotinate-nucleotide adenylyltransferase [Idiomarina seosinensis]|uniref:nicotinate-nucleotide adenylyltransferase n=1 Tax=Idiomarina seosinensis TaxID=281739 RepID=UPI00384B79B0